MLAVIKKYRFYITKTEFYTFIICRDTLIRCNRRNIRAVRCVIGFLIVLL